MIAGKNGYRVVCHYRARSMSCRRTNGAESKVCRCLTEQTRRMAKAASWLRWLTSFLPGLGCAAVSGKGKDPYCVYLRNPTSSKEMRRNGGPSGSIAVGQSVPSRLTLLDLLHGERWGSAERRRQARNTVTQASRFASLHIKTHSGTVSWQGAEQAKLGRRAVAGTSMRYAGAGRSKQRNPYHGDGGDIGYGELL